MCGTAGRCVCLSVTACRAKSLSVWREGENIFVARALWDGVGPGPIRAIGSAPAPLLQRGLLLACLCFNSCGCCMTDAC